MALCVPRKFFFSFLDEVMSLMKKETLDVLFEISLLLNTGLDKDTLATCLSLCEQGVNPEALAAVVKELKREARAKLFEATQFFDYSWSTVTAANWRKYPNELSSHVLSVDILSREVDSETGILRTERLLCCRQNVPSILKNLGLPIPEVAYFREISELDPERKEYTAKSVNLSMRSIMTVHETVIFRESTASHSPFDSTTNSNPSTSQSSPTHVQRNTRTPLNGFDHPKTLFFQQAKFEAAGFFTFARIIEEAAASRFKANASKGKKALEGVIESLMEKARSIEGAKAY
ncbi:hypothetical protein HDU97_000739 [Phlyctochytrium planicorne]|nr:hypothetical protein HDU97_000739 [Phlyctochytrium planicorne]